MLVALDIGNTAIKFGVFDGARLVAVERIEGGAAGENLFPIGAVQSASEIVAVSSSPANSAGLAEKLGRPVRLLGDDVRRAVPTTYARPAELGLDRVAAAWGARALAGRPSVLVADVGTAVTVDAIDASGRFVAVAIAPGLAAARDGLARAAPHLPPAATSPGATAVPARGTADSLRAGFVLGFAGLVDRLLDEARRAAGGADVVVLTGGGAPSVAAHLRTPHVVEPHAVLRGVVELHRAVPA
jgi:type III pantothenate kinase